MRQSCDQLTIDITVCHADQLKTGNVFTIDELLIATQALQKKQLLLIMQRLLENFNENRRGLPDLFLVKPNGKALFVEVKSEKEKVADHQITWHHFLKNHVQIPVVIFRVINI